MAVIEYRAKSIHEAIKKIKEEIGPGAMILSTKRIPKGVRDPYGQDMFEVAAFSNQDIPAKNNGKKVWEKPCKKSEKKETESTQEQPVKIETELPEKPLMENELESIRHELVSIKDMFYFLDQVQNLPDFLQMNPEVLNLYSGLIKSGISEKRAKLFIKRGYSLQKKDATSSKNITKHVLKEIHNSVSVLNPFAFEKGERIVAAFIGPTGVGKTTTIAKLAANLYLKKKKKVGLISVDSYRIGAVDQLKSYAAIMGIPCLPAFTPEDVQLAIKKMDKKDVVLIDTAGQSHLDKKRIEELDSLIGSDVSIASHLVLSATAKTSDMLEAASSFSRLKPISYVFTKVDETRKCGGIIDQVSSLKLPVSFVTNGQKVPDDIMSATKRNISQLILGSWKKS